MDAVVTILSITAFLLLALTIIGGPMILVDWARKRQAGVVARQIALTDALDGRFGVIVAPMVTKSVFGPWEVRITVPFLRSTVLARMLAVVDDMFADGAAVPANPYRIILTVAQDAQGARSERGLSRRPENWAHTPARAA